MKQCTDRKGRIIPESGSVDDSGYVTPESLYKYVSYKVMSETPQQESVLKRSLSGSSLILVEHPQFAPMYKTKPLVKSIDLSKWVIVHDPGESSTVILAAITAMETSLAIKGKKDSIDDACCC